MPNPSRADETARTLPPAKPVHETASSADEHTAGLPPSGEGDDTFDFLEKPQSKDELGRLDHFRILKELGRGGMGCVLLAEDTNLERQVALKVMLPQYARNDTAKSRFLREAKAAGKIHHDHVVTIHHVGEANGVPYIAMEFLKGMPLDRYLQEKGDLPLPMVMRIGREIALGLAEAHKKGLIHRDIKPANVWLEAPKGRVKVLDFGLARTEEDGEAHLTQSGAIVGTPAYMAPEQATGEKLDARADLFSLGVLLYRLAAGQPAFTGSTTMAMLMQVATHEPPTASAVKPGVPVEMARIIGKLMSKPKESRYGSASEFLVDWERLMKSPKQVSMMEALPRSSEPRPSRSGKQAVAMAPGPLANGHGSKRVPKWIIAAALGFFAISILAWQFIIRITDEKGNVKDIEVRKGSKVEIVEKPGEKKPLDKNKAGDEKEPTKDATNPATTPAPRDGTWMKRHEGYIAIAKKGEVEVLLLGDSITDGWRGGGAKQAWDKHFGKRKAANFGIGGDRTEHVLWRVQNGELDGIKPKVVMLMIGTNNSGFNKASQIAKGITAIVGELRKRTPETKILLLGVFPRGEMAGTPIRAMLQEINKTISKLDDGKRVFYRDIGDKFLATDGNLTKEIMYDFLHLSEQGYNIWGEAVEESLQMLLEEKKG